MHTIAIYLCIYVHVHVHVVILRNLLAGRVCEHFMPCDPAVHGASGGKITPLGELISLVPNSPCGFKNMELQKKILRRCCML